MKFNGVLSNEDTPDPRNLTIASFVLGKDDIPDEEFRLPLPEEIELIRDQKEYSSCVGHAFTMAKSILEYANTGKWIQFDPYILYGTRTKSYKGLGMYLDDALSTLNHEGAYLKRDFGEEGDPPTIIERVTSWKKENPVKVNTAKNFTITGYARLVGINDIKTALKTGMPVVVSYPVYSTLLDSEDGHVKKFNKSKDYCRGYHCMCIIGWTKNNEWIVVNSWGIDHGMKGMYYIAFDYKISEAYSVSDTVYPIKHKADKVRVDCSETLIAKPVVCDVDKVFCYAKCTYVEDNITTVKDIKVMTHRGKLWIPIQYAAEFLGCVVTVDKTVVLESEEAVYTQPIDKLWTRHNDIYVCLNDILDTFNYTYTYEDIDCIIEAKKK